MARAWSPPPSPRARAGFSVNPLRTRISSLTARSGSRIGGSSKPAPDAIARRPVGHVDAVGDVDERHAQRRTAARSADPAASGPAPHRLQQRQGDRDAQALQGRPSARSSTDRLMACLRSASGSRNGSLSTMASTSAENRYPSRAEPGDDPVDGAAVGPVEAAAQGIGEHLLGEASGERIPARPEHGPQLGRPPELAAAGEPARRHRSARPSSRVRQAADGVEVLEAEAERVHPAVARGAGRVGPVPLHPLAERARGSGRLASP